MAKSRQVVALSAVLVVCGAAAIAGWKLLEQASQLPQLKVQESTRSKVAFEAPAIPERPREDFVGSQVCRECHTGICDEFSRHPMGRSAAGVLAATPLEDYTEHTSFEAPAAGAYQLSYDVRRDETAVMHHERATDENGDLIYDQAVPIHYSVGSGERGRSYITDRGGLLFMSPITWYTQGKKWDLSPGYEHGNLHFQRRIVDGCVNCHFGRIAAVQGRPNYFREPPFPEPAIGCERCHGPAQRHVDHHQRGQKESGPDPIINPANLPASVRDQVCFQCHLTGEERIPRYGREEFDFRPGDHLADIWAVALKASDSQSKTADAVTQVEQMLSSQCFRKSDGKFGCVSCHEPHSRPAPESQVAFYRQRCLSCHGDQGVPCSQPVKDRLAVTADDSCIHCHMPATAARDVPHTSQTDHRVLRNPSASLGSKDQGKALTIYGESEGRIPPAELDRCRGILMVRIAERMRNTASAAQAIPPLEHWLEVVPNDVVAWESLGIALSLTHESNRAVEALERALEIDPSRETSLQHLFFIFHESEELEAGVECGRKLIAMNPWDFEYFGRMAHMLGKLNRVEEGIAMAERALDLQPSHFSIHEWLAQAYESLGNAEKSAEHLRRFRQFKTGR
jgi:predicted CXXCH cytochrome family protein